jgi:hypothetical protein
MPEWLKVAIGVMALTATPTIPALYIEYLWVIGREHDRSEARAENHSAQRNQRDTTPSLTPFKPRATEGNPIRGNASDQSSNSEMKLTDWLLVLVGLLQFGAIVGQIIIYRRQADIMEQQRKTAERALILAQRPRIKVREIEPEFTVNGEWWFQPNQPASGDVWIVNSGGSDAAITVWRIQVILSNSGPPVHWPNRPVNIYDGFDDRPHLSPGEHTTLRFESAEPMPAEGDAISAGGGDWRLYLLGRITYSDELGVTRTTGFFRKFQRGPMEAGGFMRMSNPDLEYED